MTATPDIDSTPSSATLALRLFREYLAPRRWMLALSILCAVVGAIMTATLGGLMNPVIKRVFEQKRFDSLLLITGVIVLCGMVRGIAQVSQSVIVNRIGHRMVGDIQVGLFGKLVRADLARLRDNHSGAYLSSVLYDATLIREAATTGIVNYTQQGQTVVFCIVGMFFEDVY
jgi:subfamily B ATP-binding cassette protein MsbA